jgi:LmbE family N-acetylglucosaminyl deacetylase
VGGHPDDPESGCGGTLARYTALGHAVTVIYLTRGEAGIPGKSHDDTAAIRSAECGAACKILGAKPIFAGQIDGATIADTKGAESLGRLISAERPNLVFTQWPIDTHLDHQAASTLTFRAWLSAGRSFELYYYEVDLGSQTMGFHPTDYVDITAVRENKKAALFAHKSQNGARLNAGLAGRSTELGAVEFAGNQPPVPGEDGMGFGDTGDLLKRSTAESLPISARVDRSGSERRIRAGR